MIIIYCILLIGGMLQSLVGFGLGLLCAPIIFLIYPEMVPGPMILNALAITSLLAWKHRRHIKFKQTGMSMASASLGILAAAVVIKHIQPHHYQLLFGILILIASIMSFMGFKPKISHFSNFLASLFSGFLGTTTSAGGATMGLLYQSEDKNKVKANLSIFFAYINLLGIITLMATGSAGMTDIVLFIETVPAVLIGWFMANLIHHKIDEDMFRRIILTVAMSASILMLVTI